MKNSTQCTHVLHHSYRTESPLKLIIIFSLDYYHSTYMFPLHQETCSKTCPQSSSTGWHRSDDDSNHDDSWIKEQCPRTQEHRRVLGLAPEPDNWLTTGTISASGGHGPILLGKSEVEEVTWVDPETY